MNRFIKVPHHVASRHLQISGASSYGNADLTVSLLGDYEDHSPILILLRSKLSLFLPRKQFNYQHYQAWWSRVSCSKLQPSDLPWSSLARQLLQLLLSDSNFSQHFELCPLPHNDPSHQRSNRYTAYIRALPSSSQCPLIQLSSSLFALLGALN